MKIRTAAVIGAGAVGVYCLAGLQEKLGDNLWTVAEGERKQRLERDGLIVNGERLDLHLRTPEEAAGADLLIIAVKYGALDSIMDAVSTVADEHTIIISLLNGVDSEEKIIAATGSGNVLYSVIKVQSTREGNNIRFGNSGWVGIYYGEKDGSISERVHAVAELFDGTPVRYFIRENILKDQWMKFALNISRNLPQAVISVGLGAYDDSEHMQYISERLREEVIDVAEAKGIHIRGQQDNVSRPTAAEKSARYSTLQDIDSKRHTEIEMFSGALVRMAEEMGMKVPYNDTVYHLIKALEEKNDGRFDY